MLGRDPSAPPLAGRGGIPKGQGKRRITLQVRGGKVYGLSAGRHKVARPSRKEVNSEAPPHLRLGTASQGRS